MVSCHHCCLSSDAQISVSLAMMPCHDDTGCSVHHHCVCRHVRSIVSLALDALAGPADVKKDTYNRRLVRAMRLRYGLDDDQPRTLKEVSPNSKRPTSSICHPSSPLEQFHWERCHPSSLSASAVLHWKWSQVEKGSATAGILFEQCGQAMA